MTDVETVLLTYIRQTHFPAWAVLDYVRLQGYSPDETLIALLLLVQDHFVGVDYRGRLCVPSTRLNHE